MIKFENTQTYGWEAAIRGMRNPKKSWHLSDSGVCATHGPDHCKECLYSNCGCTAGDSEINTNYILGPNDLKLAQTLCKAGSEHRKFLRYIHVSADITAPLYWWKEASTYKVGMTENSESTMHAITKKEFELGDFSHEHVIDEPVYYKRDSGETVQSHPLTRLKCTISDLNVCRNAYLETKDKKYWWQIIQLLPSSFNQMRTVDLNYEVLANIYRQRRGHKLDEWSVGFMDWIKSLPYAEELIIGGVKE